MKNPNNKKCRWPVFNDPETSLRRATSCTFADREKVAAHMKQSMGRNQASSN